MYLKIIVKKHLIAGAVISCENLNEYEYNKQLSIRQKLVTLNIE